MAFLWIQLCNHDWFLFCFKVNSKLPLQEALTLREMPRSLCFSLLHFLSLRASVGSCLTCLGVKLHHTSLSTRMSTTLGLQEHLVMRGGTPHSNISSSIFSRAQTWHPTSQASVLNMTHQDSPVAREGPSVTSGHPLLYSVFHHLGSSWNCFSSTHHNGGPSLKDMKLLNNSQHF